MYAFKKKLFAINSFFIFVIASSKEEFVQRNKIINIFMSFANCQNNYHIKIPKQQAIKLKWKWKKNNY